MLILLHTMHSMMQHGQNSLNFYSLVSQRQCTSLLLVNGILITIITRLVLQSVLYCTFSISDIQSAPNKWIQYFTSTDNRHALPMFTSLLNTVCSYDPVGLGLPYNHLLFQDTSEPLVDAALQILIVTLDHDTSQPGVRIIILTLISYISS